MASRGGENFAINLEHDSSSVGFHIKLNEAALKELQGNPDADDWSLTFEPGLKRAVLKNSEHSFPIAVAEVNKDEHFFALMADDETKSLDAVAAISHKFTVENVLTRSAVMSFAEKTDTERKRGLQSSKLSDEVKGKRGSVKVDQKSAFRNSTAFTKSIRKQPSEAPSSFPGGSPPLLTASTSTPSSNSTSPPNIFAPNGSSPPSGNPSDAPKKEFKFKLPTKRKAESQDSEDGPATKKSKADDLTFSFLAKFSELSIRIPRSDPETRNGRHSAISDDSQFEDYQNEYTNKFSTYEALHKILEQNKADFHELGRLYNHYATSNGSEKKTVESKIQEVYSERKETVDHLRQRYEILHEDLSDIKRCLDDFVKEWASPQL